jgi:hypothetical protein
MVLSAVEHNPDLLTPLATAQTMVYLADSLMEQKEYGKAESFYRKSLELRKTLSKQRGMGSSISKELSAETGKSWSIPHLVKSLVNTLFLQISDIRCIFVTWLLSSLYKH